jgi:hypothetical protein
MRRSVVNIVVFELLAGALLGIAMVAFAEEAPVTDAPQPLAAETENVSTAPCNAEEIVVYRGNQPSANERPCPADPKIFAATAQDRAFLVETASPGGTMTRQGPELAIGRLHPEFVRRLASAIQEARQAGLQFAGIFSAYRPPAFGVGGFIDKFNSLHTYGLAVDMSGIGGPGTPEAMLWHEIAAKHGVVCPYGPFNQTEWNHCQPTRVRIIFPENPLRETVSADGPVDLGGMFEVGNSIISSVESAAKSMSFDPHLRGPTSHEGTETKSYRPRLFTTAPGTFFRNVPVSQLGHMAMRKWRTPEHLRLSGEKVGAWAAGGVPRIVAAEDDGGRRALKARRGEASSNETHRPSPPRFGQEIKRLITPKRIVISRMLAAHSNTKRD